MRLCLHCNKPLVLIGRERKNGSDSFKDWSNRKTHKKCYRDYIELKYINLPLSD